MASVLSYVWTAEGWLYLAILLDLFFPSHPPGRASLARGQALAGP